MNIETVVFYLLAGMTLAFGALTVTTRHIFRAAIYLLFALIGVAGIYLLMEMNFMAALQVVIYVGGIVVLIIFSIFLTHQVGEKVSLPSTKKVAQSAVVALAGLALVLSVLIPLGFEKSGAECDSSVKSIGMQLLDYKNYGYVLPFEVISVFLLAALVGSIVIAMKDKTPEENK
ncbi:MAG: NADH-quinone oxidoreductase subunit J [Bacteroidota bacterium]|nr:NADH-quinone oxidoreductase subunit J [Bacteroidota bacterium]